LANENCFPPSPPQSRGTIAPRARNRGKKSGEAPPPFQRVVYKSLGPGKAGFFCFFLVFFRGQNSPGPFEGGGPTNRHDPTARAFFYPMNLFSKRRFTPPPPAIPCPSARPGPGQGGCGAVWTRRPPWGARGNQTPLFFQNHPPFPFGKPINSNVLGAGLFNAFLEPIAPPGRRGLGFGGRLPPRQRQSLPPCHPEKSEIKGRPPPQRGKEVAKFPFDIVPPRGFPNPVSPRPRRRQKPIGPERVPPAISFLFPLHTTTKREEGKKTKEKKKVYGKIAGTRPPPANCLLRAPAPWAPNRLRPRRDN